MKSYGIIRKIVNMSVGSYRFMLNDENFETKFCSEKPKKLTKRIVRDTLRLISTLNLSVRPVFKTLYVPVLKSKVRLRLPASTFFQLMQNVLFVKFHKMV